MGRANFQDLEEKYDGVKKENRALAAEVQSMNEQLSDGGRSSVEVEKLQRKLGLENEELQLALEEAEGALEQEEAKLLKLQLEYTQLKQSSDRKYADKEDELDTSRKNHQRQLEALQATIDAELRTKSDMQRDRKTYENHIIELENSLDSATKNTTDYQKTIKKLQLQIKDLQQMVDDEVQGRDDARDAAIRADRRANELAVLADENRVALESAVRAAKQAESEKVETSDRLAELQAMYNNAANGKRKAENDYHSLQEEVEELENDAKASEDKAARAMAEVARHPRQTGGRLAGQTRRIRIRRRTWSESQDPQTGAAHHGIGKRPRHRSQEIRRRAQASPQGRQARQGS